MTKIVTLDDALTVAREQVAHVKQTGQNPYDLISALNDGFPDQYSLLEMIVALKWLEGQKIEIPAGIVTTRHSDGGRTLKVIEGGQT